MRDLISNVKTVLHYAKTLTATETPSTGISVKGFNTVLVCCAIGAVTNAANSPQPVWTFKLQESDTSNANFSNVASTDVILENGRNNGSIVDGVFATVDAAAEDELAYTVEYTGTKQYLRVVATATNTPGATPISVTLHLGHPSLAPVSDV